MSTEFTRRDFLGMLGIGLGAVALGGCSSNGGNANDGSNEPAAETRTVVDRAGESIEITGPVEKYAMLTTSQMNVCAMLDKNLEHLVGAAAGGVTLTATYHHFFPELESHANYYDKGTVTAEEIIETGCQVMFWSSGKHEELVKSLKDAGITCVNVKAEDVEGIKEVIALTADVLDTDYAHSQAELFASYIDEKIAAVKSLSGGKALANTATILGSPEGMEIMPASDFGAQWLGDYGLTYLDGGSDRDVNAALTLEELYKWDPDYVIFEFGTDIEKLKSDPAWAELRALKEGHVYNCPICLNTWVMPGIEMATLYEWGSSIFFGEPTHDDVYADVKAFYKDFVAYDMNDEEVSAVLSGDAAYYLEK